jgi:UDP-glucose 4-epimerase
MKAAHELGGPQIKRFVLLGSAVAVLDSGQDISVAGKDYTEEDWNPVRTFIHIDDSQLIKQLGHRRGCS